MKHVLAMIIVASVSLPAWGGGDKPSYLLPERAPLIYPDDPKLPPYYEDGSPARPHIINPNPRPYVEAPLPPVYSPPRKDYRDLPLAYPGPYTRPPLPERRLPPPWWPRGYAAGPYYDGYAPEYYEEPYYDPRYEEERRLWKRERRREKVRAFLNGAHRVLDVIGAFAAR